MRNFVAKNDFNRASTHKSEKDYTRLSKYDLQALVMEEDWGIGEEDLIPDEERLPLKDPKEFDDVLNKFSTSSNYLGYV